jgi:hypothetical protein
MSQKLRGQAVFDLLSQFHQTVAWDEEGMPTRKEFKWCLNREPVCEPVFQASVGISPAVIKRMKARVKNPEVNTAYDEVGTESAKTDSRKTSSVVGWGLWYSLSCGDKNPTTGKLVLPHVEIKYMHEEYWEDMQQLGRESDTLAKLSLFYQVWAKEPVFQNHEISTLKVGVPAAAVAAVAAVAASCLTVCGAVHS